MKIKALKEREGQALPPMIIGKLRKGTPKRERTNKEGKKYSIFGEDFHDGFRFDTGDPLAASLFERAYGKVSEVDVVGDNGRMSKKFVGPNWITVFFNGETPEQVWETYFANFNSKGELLWKSDGETTVAWRDAAGVIQTTPKPTPPSDLASIRPSGVLTFSIRELLRVAGGDVQLETHSWYDIFYIERCLQKIFQVYGTLRDVPIVLGRRTKSVSVKDPSDPTKKISTEKSLIVLDVHPLWAAAEMQNRYEKIGMKSPLMLTDSGITTRSGAHAGEVIEISGNGEIVDVEPVDMSDVGFSMTDEEDEIDGGFISAAPAPTPARPPARPVAQPADKPAEAKTLDAAAKIVMGPKWADIAPDVIEAHTNGRTREVDALTDDEKTALIALIEGNKKEWQAYATGRSQVMPLLTVAA